MTVTNNELKVLRAIDNSPQGEYLHSPVWIHSIVSYPHMGGYLFAGVVRSLTLHGLVCTGYLPDNKGRKTRAIWLTEKGAHAYITAVGMDNVRKKVIVYP